MNTDNVPTWLPRGLGIAAGWAAAKVTEKTGVSVDPSTLVGVALFVYAGVHRFVSSKVNPSDAAKRELVAPGKTDVAVAKATEAASK